MGILGNLDGAKHSGCIISRDAPDRNVFGKKYDRAWRNPKTVKIEGYKLTLLDVHGIRAPNVVEWLEGTCDVILRAPAALIGHKNNFYNNFGAIPRVHHNIKNGCFDGIL